MDCSVWRAANFNTRCLQALTNLSMPKASMAGLVVIPSFLDFDFDPKALAIEAVLVAQFMSGHREKTLVRILVGAAPSVVHAHRVVGRNRTVEEAPPRFAGVLRAS